MKPYPPSEFWKRCLSVAEVEAELARQSSELGLPLSPQWLERWATFKAEMLPNDELWYWENFPEPLTGGAGYCLVRDGQSILSLATMRS
jgi:hypothetical protein